MKNLFILAAMVSLAACSTLNDSLKLGATMGAATGAEATSRKTLWQARSELHAAYVTHCLRKLKLFCLLDGPPRRDVRSPNRCRECATQI